MINKKKIIIFSGTHPRHLYVNSIFLNLKKKIKIKIIFMKRENLEPKPPKHLNNRDRKNFIFHFKTRKESELKNFGDLKYTELFKDFDYKVVTPEKLNSQETYKIVKNFKPNLIFIFGIDLIKKPLINLVKRKGLNLHLGLSPWFKGSATLFWPFYLLQPNLAGVTFHKITSGIDDGKILHQSKPRLSEKDKIHDVAIKAVKKAKSDLFKILKKFIQNKKFKYQKQKNSGKTFYTKNFKAHHLRVIYDLFDNKIVKYHLKNKKNKKIKLINFV